MMDFHRWFSGQGRRQTEEVDDTFYAYCNRCGKEDVLSLAEYESGDTGWFFIYDPTPGKQEYGLCGSQHCVP